MRHNRHERHLNLADILNKTRGDKLRRLQRRRGSACKRKRRRQTPVPPWSDAGGCDVGSVQVAGQQQADAAGPAALPAGRAP